MRRLDAGLQLANNDFERLKAIISLPFFSDEDRTAYLEAWRQPGAADGIVRWYQREGLGPQDAQGTPARGNTCPEVSPQIISVPSLIVYTEGDLYVRPHAFSGLEAYMPRAKIVAMPGTHWICDEQPELVNRTIREFLAGDAPDTNTPEHRARALA